jgi:hypothetical protein
MGKVNDMEDFSWVDVVVVKKDTMTHKDKQISEQQQLLADCSVVIEYYAKAREIYAMSGVWQLAEELLPKLRKGE